MSTIIQIKYSPSGTGGSGTPATNDLTQAELAYSYVSDKLFIGDEADLQGDVAAIVIGGKYFTDMMDHTLGQLQPSSAILTDANSKVDRLLAGNIRIADGANDNEIDTSTGNLTIDSAGGTVTVDDNLVVTGNLEVTGTQTFTGQATFTSANVTDLTSGRVVLAGTNGELQDSAQLLYTQGSGVINVDITGTLTVDELLLDGTSITAQGTNAGMTLALPAGTGEFTLTSTTGLAIPVGLNTQRPSTAGNGKIRYNTDQDALEASVEGSWRTVVSSLAQVVDQDNDTYLAVEQGADDDTIRLYTGGTELVTANLANGVVVNSGYELTADGGVNIGSIDIGVTNADTITLDGGSTITATGQTMTLDPAPAAGDNGGTLVVRGNLEVTGTQTTVNSTIVEIEDNSFRLGQEWNDDNQDRGIETAYNTGTAVTAGNFVTGTSYYITSLGTGTGQTQTDFTAIGASSNDLGTQFTATGAGSGDGTAIATSTEVIGFFGYDRGVEDAFTFYTDTSSSTLGDARFNNLKLEGNITELGGAAPTDGQLLIGGTSSGELVLGTLNGGNSITVTNGNNTVSIAVDPAQAVANGSANATHRGAASFDTAQFSVTSGHATITLIEGGTF